MKKSLTCDTMWQVLIISLLMLLNTALTETTRMQDKGHDINGRTNNVCYKTAIKETIHSCHMIRNGPMSVELSHGIPQDAFCVTTNGMCLYCDLGTLRETDCRSGRPLKRNKRFIFWLIGLAIAATVAAVALSVAPRIRPRPRPPVNEPPTIICPTVNNKVAPPLTSSVRVSWKSPKVFDDHGGYKIKQTRGRKSGSMFGDGSYTITYKVTDRGGITDYCSFVFKVTVIHCSRPSTPWHGDLTCDRRDNIYGNECWFSCNVGYWLDGNYKSICQRNWKYSSGTPTCRKKKCQKPTLPSNGYDVSCTSGYYYQSNCFLSCRKSQGYDPMYGNIATCQANRSWRYKNWKCEDTQKPTIFNCPEGEQMTTNITYTWPTIQAKDNSHSVTLTQTKGPNPGSGLNVGPQIVEYIASDPSGNQATPCTFSITYEEPSCSPPLSTGDDNDPTFICKSEKHHVGESCQAVCKYSKVEGSKYIRCERTGGVIPISDWVPFNGSYPVCYKKPCPDLEPPMNGALICDRYMGGTVCQMVCNENFDIPDKMRTDRELLICLANKNWTPTDTFPDCTAITFPDVHNLPSKLYYYFQGNCSDSETDLDIRNMFLDNLARSDYDFCIEGKCSVENVKVNCGPVVDVKLDDSVIEHENISDYEYYHDDHEYYHDDYEYNYGDQNGKELVIPVRKRRDVTERSQPVAIWTRTTRSVDRVSSEPEGNNTAAGANDTHSERIEHGTGNMSRSSEQDLSGGESGEGSGEIETVAKIPLSRTVINLSWVVKNVSRVVTEDMMKEIADTTLNRTRTTVLGTRLANITISFHGNFTFKCGPGKVVSNSSSTMCVECPRGTFHNQELETCDPCPLHTFSNTTGQIVCITCGHLFGNKKTGSLTPESCIPMCSPGYYSPTGLTPCTPCPLGTVQAQPFGKSCDACPSDSTTLKIGSSDWKQCVQFDVIANGPVHLKLGPTINKWIEDLTITFWIRILPQGNRNPNISLIFHHPSKGHQMTLILSKEINAWMKDHYVRLGSSIPSDQWVHMAVVWKGYPTSVNIYRAGRRVGYFNGYAPLCFFPNGTELEVYVARDTGVMLREVYVIPLSNTSSLVTRMAGSCTPGKTGFESLITKMVPSDPSKVSLVIPSVCSDLDRCDPSPCPGHFCQSFKHGFQCTCRRGFSGVTCSTPPDYCVVDNKCQHNAICENVEGGVNCTCTDDYKGEHCQIAIVHGKWGSWSAWSSCDVTCGGGQRSRTRKCNNPAPEPDVGKPCSGLTREESECNTKTCPECKSSQLTLGRGININCTSASVGSMNCSVSCDEGLVPEQNSTLYTCRDELWIPSTKTISCVDVQIPEDIGFEYTIPYKTAVGPTEAQDLQAIREKMTACASQSFCLKKKSCDFSVILETCRRAEGGCLEFPEGYRATLKFTFDVVVDNTSAEVTKKNIEGAWKSMNNTYNDLEAMYAACFPVQLSTGLVPPGTVGVGSTLTCQNGFVPDQGYCSACAPGTREENGVCYQCDHGWYQEENGRQKCDVCPTAFWTYFVGSSFQSECNAPPADAFMLLTDSVDGHIWSVNMSDFDRESVLLPANIRLGSSGYDPLTKQIFYVDKSAPAIHSVGPENSRTYVTLDLVADVSDITIDPVSRLIFYTDSGNDVIGLVSMTTMRHKIVIREEPSISGSIAVDPANGVMYWTDWGRDQRIEKANYDGTGRQVLVSSHTMWPEGLALDLQEKKLYWSDVVMKTVEVTDLAGSNRKTLIHSDSNPSSIMVFQDYIFYSAVHRNHSVVMRLNKDGTGLVKTELPPFQYLSDMNSHRKETFSSASNGCTVNNGGCSHLCFPKPNGNKICACAEGFYKNENEFNCTRNATQSVWDLWM